jgi:hypothetical protein
MGFAQQSSWDSYKPRTLQSIMEAHAHDTPRLEPGKKRLVITGDSVPSQIKLVYQGKSRAIEGKRKELVQNWQKSYKTSVPQDPGLFATEMLFREGKREYWIAIQKPLVEPLPKEVKVGQTVTTYVIWMGAIGDGEGWEWLFAMNEFDTPEPEKSSSETSKSF